MSKVKELRALIEDMKRIRSAAQTEIERINGDTMYSDDYKARARYQIIEAAKKQLAEIQEKADAVLPAFEKLTELQKRFDYSNPELLAAAQFVQINGANVPESAWKAMIADHINRPSELHYLATLFQQKGLVNAAIDASEAEKEAYFNASLPRRLSDGIFYSASQEPMAHVDTSALENDLEALERVEELLTSSETAE